MSPFSKFLRTDEPSARYLLESGSYRDFLSRFFEVKKKLNNDYSYNVFAKAAAIAKSLPRDVLMGERRLTERSLPKFLKAMALPGLMEEFFIKLVESDSNPTLSTYLSKLSQMYLENHFTQSFSDNNFQDFTIPFIYAASGRVGEGCGLDVIRSRTGLSESKVLDVIEQLEAMGLGKYDEKTLKFIPTVSQVHVEARSDSKHFLDFYLHSLSLQKATVEATGFPSPPKVLFFNNVFSVNERDIPQLKEELQIFLKSFVLKSENPVGDSVSILNLGFFKYEFTDE
ncbi:MAG TPA: hypothetical protein VNJ01_04215 [Bacteriovoracaceae bacterium]|nr:hypothetical protein [Bacteriovoracaceae bacterium]